MGTFDKFRQHLRTQPIHIQLLYANVLVYVLLRLVSVGFLLFNRDGSFAYNVLTLPADLLRFLSRPWSIVTYMFLHADLLHLLFNMLWLYWFGTLFLHTFSARHLRGVYLLGGLSGGLLFLLCFQVFPYFRALQYGVYLVGASASVLAIVVATAVRMPHYRVRLLLLGDIPIAYIATFVVITDLLLITSNNGGGHIAHIGGALAGWWFAASLTKGNDRTKWINRTLDFFILPRAPRRKKNKNHMRMNPNKPSETSKRKTTPTREQQIDLILEKLKKSGYESLNADEKKQLFDESNK